MSERTIRIGDRVIATAASHGGTGTVRGEYTTPCGRMLAIRWDRHGGGFGSREDVREGDVALFEVTA